jgi:phenylalanyl-tRNA synthetase beta chain
VYTAQPVAAISFVPLNQREPVDGPALAARYQADPKLKAYVPLLGETGRYPVVLDSRGTICSIPPLINSEHTKITLTTRNILIEVTATDATKGDMLLKTLLASFSLYCRKPYRYALPD